MNTPAVCQHVFSYDDAGRSNNMLLKPAMQQLSAKVFELNFEYLHIYRGCVKMQDMKMQDVRMKDQVARQENAGHENEGPNCKA